ncbi:MAG: tetratricopeptide repeat protein [Thermoleophilia bacterium]
MKIKGYYWAIIAAAALVVLAIFIVPLFTGSDENSTSGSPHSADQLASYESIDYTPVIETYQSLIQENPNDTFVLDSFGNFYMQTGKYKEAKDQYEKAATLNPNNPSFFAGTGEAYSMLGMVDLANREIDKGLALDPASQTLMVLKGNVLANQNKRDEAKTWWQKAYDINPTTQIGIMAGQLLQDQAAGSSSGSSGGSSNPHATGEIPLD